MTTFLARGLSSSKLRAMGFNASEHQGVIRLRRGHIVGSYVPNGRFKPGVLKLTNMGDNEDDEFRAVADIQKVTPGVRGVRHVAA